MFGLTHKLALSNLLKNRRLYYPFALMTTISTAVFYIFSSLIANPDIKNVWGAGGVTMVLRYGLVIITITITLMIFYANSFVMKQRSKEFGLYSMLGLEKKHLIYMNAIETLVFSLVTVGLGIGTGILLDKLFYALLLKIMRVKVILASTFQWQTLILTLVSLLSIFVLVSFLNAGRLGLKSSMAMLKEQKKGEKKGRFLWFQSLLGVGIISLAYYMSQLVVSPVASMIVFLQATLLVILATYLLFNAGTISLLRFLQKRSSYYYKPANFISVSNLVFRMRKNAVGLATICILSTMFLVTLVGGTNIYLGGQDLVEKEAPNDFLVFAGNGLDEKGQLLGSEAKMLEHVQAGLKASDIPIRETIQHTFRLAILSELEGNQMTSHSLADQSGLDGDSLYMIGVFSTADYEALTGQTLDLQEGEAAVYERGHQFKKDQPLVLNGQELKIVTTLSESFTLKKIPMFITRLAQKEIMLVVKDESQFLRAADEHYYLGFETDLTRKEQADKYELFQVNVTGAKQIEGRLPFNTITTAGRAQLENTYFFFAGTLFFIGIFLALIFFMATSLVIYYKQISEGYEDRERFVILQQTGLDEDQTRRTIRKQVLTVFFLPLLVALTHLAFAYKMLSMILKTMGLTNQVLIFQVTLAVCGLYLLVYILIYSLTSRSYHQIVKSQF